MSIESYRESPGKFDSRTLSRETLSRWTGRKSSKGGFSKRGHARAIRKATSESFACYSHTHCVFGLRRKSELVAEVGLAHTFVLSIRTTDVRNLMYDSGL